MCRLHSNTLECCHHGEPSTLNDPSPTLPLLHLPNEILLLIKTHLDYSSLCALRSANQHLRHLVQLSHIRTALQQLQPLIPRPTHRPTLLFRYPCYTCLALLPSSRFSLVMKTGKRSFCAPLAYGRRCMTYWHAGKSAFVDRRRTEHFYFEEGCWKDCRRCGITVPCRFGFLGEEDECHRREVCDDCYG
jgi:hypothetical protein